MSHTQTPRRREIYRESEAARRERTATRKRARYTKRVQTGAIVIVAKVR